MARQLYFIVSRGFISPLQGAARGVSTPSWQVDARGIKNTATASEDGGIRTRSNRRILELSQGAFVITGGTLIVLAGFFIVFDGTRHLARIQAVVDTVTELGFPTSLPVTLAVLELLCLILCFIPPTSVLVAISSRDIWDAYFSMLKDKFGILWMVNYTYPKKSWQGEMPGTRRFCRSCRNRLPTTN